MDTRVIPIVRGVASEHVYLLANALYNGGIRAMEITMNTENAPQMITALRTQFAERMWIGAGTVLTMGEAKSALEAGAQFFVTPNVDLSIIEFAVENNLHTLTGAMTPSEIVTAYENGASAVKVFPIRSLGSSYIRDLQGPMGHIPLIAVGGVSVDNAAEYFQSGCVGIGVGGSLVNRKLIEVGDFARIQQVASRFIEIARQNAVSN
ncbi:bifunctional 4-hydroxy-2-oxoglutarate aldolase/2-dehydro-3-deoxy-phosphogluconate aldolase [Alicyclobacillus sp. SO9]|nr:bifunctional 4-hydroxy-2-oxoglutarate aldolase/2-dehydro-3-deoxy-phosphogluconate aldolase [Alicyclobacillus sp. SO9]